MMQLSNMPKKFPSPIGELHFSMKEKNLYERIKKVSVPYRGATFLNEGEESVREN